MLGNLKPDRVCGRGPDSSVWLSLPASGLERPWPPGACPLREEGKTTNQEGAVTPGIQLLRCQTSAFDILCSLLFKNQASQSCPASQSDGLHRLDLALSYVPEALETGAAGPGEEHIGCKASGRRTVGPWLNPAAEPGKSAFLQKFPSHWWKLKCQIAKGFVS